MRTITRRIASLALLAGTSIAATGCPGDPGPYKYGFATIIDSKTTGERAEVVASQTEDQPAIRLKMRNTTTVAGFTVSGDTYAPAAIQPGSSVTQVFRDVTPFVSSDMWQIYTCLESDHSDCRLRDTWTAN